MTDNTTTPGRALPQTTPTVWPSIGFTDVDAGVRLLTDVLGFVVTALHRDEDGNVQHAEARRPEGGGVMFGSRDKPGDWGALGAAGVYITTRDRADVEAAWQRAAVADGVEVIRELVETDYGSLEFGIRDRDGNLWSMGTYLGE